MKAYIITLKDNSTALEQLKICKNSADKHGWNAEVFWAIDGKDLTIHDFEQRRLYLNPNTKIYNRPGAQGCFLSHWTLWHHCVEINEPIIILESDTEILDTLPQLDLSYGLLKLHVDRNTKHSSTTGIWGKGAYAYALSPEHATALIEGAMSTEVKPADKAIGSNFVRWRYIETPIVALRSLGSSTTSWLR